MSLTAKVLDDLTIEAYELWVALADHFGHIIRIHGYDAPQTMRAYRKLKRAEARWMRRLDKEIAA